MNKTLSSFQSALDAQIKLSGMTFNPSIDLRNDLVNHYGYAREEVSVMSDDQVFQIIDSISEMENGESSIALVNIPCSNCNSKQLIDVDFSDIDDCYELKCPKCNEQYRMHYTAYDSCMEYLEECGNEQVAETVVKEDNRTIKELNFSLRTETVLLINNVSTVNELRKLSEIDLMKFRNMGRKSLDEVIEFLNN